MYCIIPHLSAAKAPKAEAASQPEASSSTTASFHNFKSQNFKLSVSNPKRTYVAHVSVLSRI